MMALVLPVIAIISQLSRSSCHHLNSDIIKDRWLFPNPSKESDTKFEKQMPPHHEPDAVLINTGGGGPSGRPGGGFPGGPRVFGIPGSPGYPGVFGMPGGPPLMPRGPSVFGKPGGPPQMPGGPGVFDMPGGPPQMPGPSVFGMPRGPPQMPGPGVFGMPCAPPQMPGRPSQIPGEFHTSGDPQPGVFGVPGEVPQMPGRPGRFKPNAFELALNPATSRGPSFFGNPGQLDWGSSTGSGVFIRYGGQNGLMIPNGPNTFGMPGQGRPVMFGVPGEPGYRRPNAFDVPGELTFGRPTVFAGAGGDNIPFIGIPGFFVPGEIPNMPQPADEFPVTKGMEPNKFIPGGLNGVRPSGFPSVFYPDSSFFPASPENSGSSGGNSPRKNIFVDSGGREMYDDPTAAIFPITDKSLLKSGVSK